MVQGRLVTQGYRAAVRERLGERHLELYLKQMGHQRQHKRLSRLLMQLGKAGKEVSLSWVVKVAKFMWGWQPTNFKLQQRGDKEQATCQLEGCSGVECGWHVAAECQHKEMVECRRQVVEQMRGRLEKLQKLPRDLRWAVAQLWGLDEGGVMQRWEEMDWAREGGAWEERASALRGASDSRVALMGRLCMEKPSDFRATGWVSTDWEEVLEEMGVGRELVQQLMQVMRKGVEELWVQTWEVRNRLTHAEEEAAAQDKRKELLGELREGHRELGDRAGAQQVGREEPSEGAAGGSAEGAWLGDEEGEGEEERRAKEHGGDVRSEQENQEGEGAEGSNNRSWQQQQRSGAAANQAATGNQGNGAGCP